MIKELPVSDTKLHLVTGRAGRLMPFIVSEIGRRHQMGLPCILLVPQQYTLEAERTLIRELKLPGMIDIEVLSPARLVSRIREATGTGGKLPLDARGRCMAISCALAKEQDQLEYYSGTCSQPGLADKVSALLGDLQRTGIQPEALKLAADTHTGAAAKKERDIARIWTRYDEILAGRFADAHTQMADASNALKESGVLDGVSLFVYGFDLLQPGLCMLLAESLRVTRLTAVTMTMDPAAEDRRIFAGQELSVQELQFRINERQLRMAVPLALPDADTSRAPELVYLEKSLFTWSREPYGAPQQAIAIHMAANPYQEARAAAEQLLAWHSAGIPWGEMAITMPSFGTGLDRITEETFRAAGIPYYAARKESVLRHGLCRMLQGALRAATDGFDTRDVITYAASGYAGFTDEEAALLRNGAAARGLRRNKWLKPLPDRDGDDAEKQLEALRLRAVTPLVTLRDALKAAENAVQSAEAVYALLEENHVWELLNAQELRLMDAGMTAEASRSRQVWKLCLDLLDQMYQLLGNEAVKPDMVCRLIEAGFNSIEISGLPPEPDTVTIGETGHLMTGSISALIMMGMQAEDNSGGMVSLLTERERETLSQLMHCQIGLPRKVQNAMHQADIYRTMALPSRHLLLTYSSGDQAGTVLLPSGLIGDIRKLFAIENDDSILGMDRLLPPSPELAMDELGGYLRRKKTDKPAETAWVDALQWLWTSPNWHDRMDRMLTAFQTGKKHITLMPEIAFRLFSGDSTSISRLERYAECPYHHYLDYGLQLKQPELFQFDPLEQGEFFHSVIERFTNLAGDRWAFLEDDRIDAYIGSALSEATEKWQNGPLTEDGLGTLQGKEAVQKVHSTIWACTRQLRNASFVPLRAEVVFDGKDGNLPGVILTLENGHRISLRGKIDRIDSYTAADGGLYLRITDYKSSTHELEPVRLWHGLQLQLMLYLRAATNGLHGQPAGALYMCVQDPAAKVDSESADEAKKAIAREMQLKGYILAEPEIVAAMDREVPAYSFPGVLKNDGSIRKGSHGIDRRQMEGMMRHAEKKATELSNALRAGEISPSPAALGEWNACQYCTAKEACPRGIPRDLSKDKTEDLIERMAEDAENMD